MLLVFVFIASGGVDGFFFRCFFHVYSIPCLVFEQLLQALIVAALASLALCDTAFLVATKELLNKAAGKDRDLVIKFSIHNAGGEYVLI